MFVEVTLTRFFPRRYEVVFSVYYIRGNVSVSAMVCARHLKFRILDLMYCTYVFMKKKINII